MKHEILFFIEDRFAGSGTRGDALIHGKPCVPTSLAYCCRICGTVWARIICTTPASQWQFIPRRCPKHGPPLLGAFDDDEFMQAFPIQLLAREFLIATAIPSYRATLICDGM